MGNFCQFPVSWNYICLQGFVLFCFLVKIALRKEKSIAAFQIPLLNQILVLPELQVEGKRPYSTTLSPQLISQGLQNLCSQVPSFPCLLIPQWLQVTLSMGFVHVTLGQLDPRKQQNVCQVTSLLDSVLKSFQQYISTKNLSSALGSWYNHYCPGFELPLSISISCHMWEENSAPQCL